MGIFFLDRLNPGIPRNPPGTPLLNLNLNRSVLDCLHASCPSCLQTGGGAALRHLGLFSRHHSLWKPPQQVLDPMPLSHRRSRPTEAPPRPSGSLELKGHAFGTSPSPLCMAEVAVTNIHCPLLGFSNRTEHTPSSWDSYSHLAPHQRPLRGMNATSGSRLTVTGIHLPLSLLHQ